MARLTENELIEELKKRFDENHKALYDLRAMTRKLEDVNRKLEESEALKTNFLSNIRNEIINPLTSILALSHELAGQTDPACRECSRMSNSIFFEAFNLDFQLRNIFTAAEIEAGEAVPGISNVDIEMLIRNVIDSFMHLINSRQLVVSFDCAVVSEHERFFRTDSEKLKTIALNLLSNAIKFSPGGGSILVKAWRHDGQLNLLVEDSGIGIDESDQQAIFERFRQLDSGVSKNYSGHGLGLSITKALVELLSGTISVASIKGKGSIFTVFIPESHSDMPVDVFSTDGDEFIFEDEEKF